MVMSTLSVTLEQGNQSKRFHIVNTELNVDAAEGALLKASCLTAQKQDEQVEVLKFLLRTDTTISFPTPQSSNVEHVTFNAVQGEIGFVFDNGSVSTYPATFQEFIDAMSAPSIGKLQWKYRRAAQGR